MTAVSPRRGRRPADGTLGPPGIDAILEASVAVMSEHGYHGTSVRDIAERAGLSPAALYHHFASKHDVLATLMDRGIEELLRRTRAAREAAEGPVATLLSIVDAHVRFHLEDQRAVLLGVSELRGLEEPVRSQHIAKRQQQQRIFDDTVTDGVRRELFHTKHPAEAARAVVVMCTGVAGWYHPGGPLTHEQVAGRYQDLALDLVGLRG
ncbi:TetR/AcrR family transcriptional regulator [Amycolatopsis acidiphila]|uniref:TetR/AcrR family transcriptional regulator n=1 Tax=Amycolatopsis acidiphila TaxID=715473 RepID=A0A558A6Z5_9PSEU|nr:TetR/AcrR family transcriptional regulator [Amycolatopsis acidiphila]TVT20031.1 TetR/AcrR family transcriptional regulator [Amycolatopsis acidiphila]UIJ63495.1 TetR/AcrR family transcriptional regulator [Amycolatopsis acidiphila]GHG68600.1 TetR family transcriptional regulator [Amycolatopsis acidiphila]